MKLDAERSAEVKRLVVSDLKALLSDAEINKWVARSGPIWDSYDECYLRLTEECDLELWGHTLDSVQRKEFEHFLRVLKEYDNAFPEISAEAVSSVEFSQLRNIARECLNCLITENKSR
jgi:hypothetical protein